MVVKDWTKYDNFKKKEFDCKFSGENMMQTEFMDKLQQLRSVYGKPMHITSGYRSKMHPVERSKSGSGPHNQGLAADIAVEGADAVRLLNLALQLGFTGIGVQQKGYGRYIHLDLVKSSSRPMIWSY